MSRARVLLVGGGLTSAAIACRLSQLPVTITCWDKASKPGGRMTTHRRGAGQVDLGAQYITCKLGEDRTLFGELVSSGLLQPVNSRNGSDTDHKTEVLDGYTEVAVDNNVWQESSDPSDPILLCNPTNYVAPHGSEAIVHHLFKKSRLLPHPNHFLSDLTLPGADQTLPGAHWTATTNSKVEEFDAVILTVPVPQYMGQSAAEGKPTGNFRSVMKETSPEVYQNMKDISFNACFCLGLLYDSVTPLPVDWESKYFPHHDVVRYVSIDSVRRGAPDAPTAICVQSQRAWAAVNIELAKTEAAPLLLAALEEVVPGLPAPSHTLPHKWRFSQTARPYPGAPGAVVLHAAPLLVAAGDSFTQSNVEGCLLSAEVVTELIKDRLNLG